MKKIIAIIMTLAMLLCVCASAETVHRQKNIDMESVLSDMVMHVEFSTEDIDETSIYATIYDEVIYDIVDINKLQVGDTIETSYGDITVETLENNDGMVVINGGFDADGVVLATEDDTNGYFEMDYEMPAMVVVGQAQLGFGDTITINTYKMTEDLSPDGEGYDTIEVPGTEAAAKLAEITEKFYGSVNPYGTKVTLGSEENIITEITIDYIP